MGKATRPTTQDELLERVTDAAESIDALCVRFSGYVEHTLREVAQRHGDGMPPLEELPLRRGTIGELATQLRSLLPTGGRGNNLWGRAAEAVGIGDPLITVGPAAVPAPVLFDRVVWSYAAVGSVPTSGTGGESQGLGALLDLHCVHYVEAGEQWSMTWREVIRQLADKYGAHVDDDRPIQWDRLDRVHVSGVPTLSLLIYRLAHVVAAELNGLLAAAGVGSIGLVAPPWPAGVEVSYASMIETKKRPGPPIRANDACPCGSGKKWKRCHRPPANQPFLVPGG